MEVSRRGAHNLSRLCEEGRDHRTSRGVRRVERHAVVAVDVCLELRLCHPLPALRHHLRVRARNRERVRRSVKLKYDVDI